MGNYSKEKICIALIIIEILIMIFLVYQASYGELYRESFGEDGDIPSSEQPIALESGSYEITLLYRTRLEGVSCQPMADQAVGMIPVGEALLPSYRTEQSFEVRLHQATERFYLEYSCADPEVEEEFVEVAGVTIQETRQSARARCLIAAFCFAVLDFILIYGWIRSGKSLETERRNVLFLLCATWIIASMPLLVNYMIRGFDFNFHMMRIEGLAKGIMEGQIPVRIQSGWLNDYGYAVSVMYGDILLYLPAFLRIGGFTLQAAYKVYVMAIAAVTVATAYICAKRIGGSMWLGVLGSMMYTLSVYRMVNVYTRAAVGEYTAMAFLPLVFLGLYLLLHTEEKRRAFLCLLAGYTLILQSHLLTFEMTVVFSGIYCLLHFHTFMKKLPLLVGTALLTILLNLGFLVPFADYMLTQSLWIRGGVADNMQGHGLFLPQLFQIFGNTLQGSYNVSDGIKSDLWLGPGIAVTLIVILFAWEYLVYRRQLKKRMSSRQWGEQCRLFGMLVLALWMSTYVFPWRAIGKLPLIGTYIVSYQFAWRFLAIVSVLAMALGVHVFQNMDVLFSKQAASWIKIVMGALITVQALVFVNVRMIESDASIVVDTSGINSVTAISGGEYLVQGMVRDHVTEAEVTAGDGVLIERTTRNGNRFVVACENTSKTEQWLSVPLFAYKGYRARDLGTGDELSVTMDPNGAVQVHLPVGYVGECMVYFRPRISWQMGVVISVLTFIGIILYMTKARTGRKYS